MTFSEYRDLTPSDNLENCDEWMFIAGRANLEKLRGLI